jgi:hypothetical protein
MEQSAIPPVQMNDVLTSTMANPEARGDMVVSPAGCATCGGSEASTELSPNRSRPVSYIYAIGKVEARFPNLAAEKEFAQATGRTDTAGKTDQQTFHSVLSKLEHRYLVRQLCWVLTIQGMETYLLVPRDPADIDLPDYP